MCELGGVAFAADAVDEALLAQHLGATGDNPLG